MSTLFKVHIMKYFLIQSNLKNAYLIKMSDNTGKSVFKYTVLSICIIIKLQLNNSNKIPDCIHQRTDDIALQNHRFL